MKCTLWFCKAICDEFGPFPPPGLKHICIFLDPEGKTIFYTVLLSQNPHTSVT